MFLVLDALRRRRGQMLDAMGFGPEEAPYRILVEEAGMRLRAYGDAAGEPRRARVLIVPAPFKRGYIWDLRPDVSVVRRCQAAGLAVFMLEWRDPAPGDDLGLADFAYKFPLAAVRAIAQTAPGGPIVLTGHSLGGTFAAIFAALHPELVSDLWLIDAPLVFGPGAGDRLADLLRMIAPGWLAALAGEPVAGSFISALAVAALPDEFVLAPAEDFVASGWDPDRQRLHAQVLRWTQDEFPLPRSLFLDVANQLYREDRFAGGALLLAGETVGLGDLRTPVAAVLNPASAVVPAAATARGLRLAQSTSVSTFVYEPSPGCALNHVGPLVSPRAHASIWPDLIKRAGGV
jgi:polyhydroxyalkanoate synthase subunit PhaC